jgi:hypothetical protein
MGRREVLRCGALGGCVESRMAEVFATCCGVNLAGATAGVSALSGFWGLPVLGSCWAGTQGNAGYRIAFFASAQSTVTLIGDPWNPHRWRSNSGNAKVGHWQTGIENFGCIHVQTSGILASAGIASSREKRARWRGAFSKTGQRGTSGCGTGRITLKVEWRRRLLLAVG